MKFKALIITACILLIEAWLSFFTYLLNFKFFSELWYINGAGEHFYIGGLFGRIMLTTGAITVFIGWIYTVIENEENEEKEDEI